MGDFLWYEAVANIYWGINWTTFMSLTFIRGGGGGGGGGVFVGFFGGEGGLKLYWEGNIDVFAGSWIFLLAI